MGNGEIQTSIQTAVDIVTARQRGRAQAISLGFSGADVTLVAAAISEVARNIVDHAKEGEIVMQPIEEHGRRGLQIVARDQGPGIADVAQAMQYGYSTRRGLGVGLPGAKWLMDEFDIASTLGRGTTVTMRKWLPEPAEAEHSNGRGGHRPSAAEAPA
ncbi:MAG TPA: anti-sigma regulatory factor [Opitutaceae bacterium]|jgi:serine/threonine-protein kinase RsbT|nr:anti-sigma regulatory factor [Opitutaceae bacterium]